MLNAFVLNIKGTNLTIPYWVLYTDYESALIWSCNDYLKIFHLEYFWILSRKPYLNEEKLNYLLDVLQLSGINVNQLVRTEQVGCN
jgi:lipocalin